jgi:DNA-binding transcriptional LysR family regulator
MQVESLKIFCDVARLGSFSRGAEANGVLQSAASQAVHQLEKHLGAALIDRSRRPWQLTAEGRLFYEGCRDVLARHRDLEARVRRHHADADAVVRVAAIYSVGLGDMSQYIRRFSKSSAQVRVQVSYLHPDQVYESVIEEKADLGIVSFPQWRRELTVIPWREEPMVVACPPQHRLAGRKKKTALKEIAGEKFVGFDRDLVIRKQVDRFLRQHGVAVEVVVEFDNIEAIKRAVEVASGISILPEPTLNREVKTGTLVAVPFTPGGFVRPLGIIHLRGRKLHPSAQSFIELLQNGSEGEP